MTHAGASSPYEAILATADGRLGLGAVRSGKWELLAGDPRWGAFSDSPPGGVGMGVRAPDGVTILAPFEQASSSLYPGVSGGCAPEATMLFDLEEDPAEQRNVARLPPGRRGKAKASSECGESGSSGPAAAESGRDSLALS